MRCLLTLEHSSFVLKTLPAKLKKKLKSILGKLRSKLKCFKKV